MRGDERTSTTGDRTRDLTRRTELLAPAGRWDALEAVVRAGANAVHLDLKQFNMRMHRSDFNFTLAQVAEAVALLHGQGKHLYVTLNALLADEELSGARDTLLELDQLGVDAVIVQDLATAQLAAELDLRLPLHASTMLNVHHAEQARALNTLGFTRVIASRDIDIRAAGGIGRLADVEVEYFVHGDMCVSHSGQCVMSGVLFGKSANRGECMKPCRWEYDLVRLDDEQVHGTLAEGHLLAIKDLCLLRHIPELIQAGIARLKIEGRMRDAAYLRDLVHAYRQSIDLYYACPPTFALEVEAIEQTYRRQVRELSTLTTLGGASHRGLIDVTGLREPLLLTNGHAESKLAEQALDIERFRTADAVRDSPVDLSVSVGSRAAAETAMRAGADRVYLAAACSQLGPSVWSLDDLLETVNDAHASGIRVGLRTPRVTTQREWAETRWILERLVDCPPDFVLVHHLGMLRLARTLCPDVEIVADYGFNVLNHATVAALARFGADHVTFSNEGGLTELVALARGTTLPLEILAHGPITGMLLDHCVIALHGSPQGRMDVCRGPCRHVVFGLRDRQGQTRRIVADQHCRNHLLTAHDLAILPWIDAFRLPAVACLRIEGQFESADWVETVTRAYRQRLDGDDDESCAQAWRAVCKASPRPMNLGPYTRSIVHTRSAATVIQERAGS